MSLPPSWKGRDESSVPEGDVLGERLNSLAARLASHGGGIELVDVSTEGTVRVRLTGACTGCYAKPLTVAVVVKPELEGVPGVSHVHVAGGRISFGAEKRVSAVRASRAGGFPAAASAGRAS